MIVWRTPIEERKLNKKGMIMKAIAVKPGLLNTVHLTELPAPKVGDIPNGRGVLVRVLRVGVDGTDKEINAAD
jgi:threonine dehydrogenase-like Zn-dependent dehydrogenase